MLGCRQNSPGTASRKLVEVGIESHPQGSGYAHKTVKADGSITGGHLSGGDAPRVFESKSRVSSEDMATLKALAAALPAEPTNKQPSPPDQKLEGYTTVVVIFSDGTTVTAHAKWGGRFESETMQKLWDTISRYEVGAW